jgi:hypothetical protein
MENESQVLWGYKTLDDLRGFFSYVLLDEEAKQYQLEKDKAYFNFNDASAAKNGLHFLPNGFPNSYDGPSFVRLCIGSSLDEVSRIAQNLSQINIEAFEARQSKVVIISDLAYSDLEKLMPGNRLILVSTFKLSKLKEKYPIYNYIWLNGTPKSINDETFLEFQEQNLLSLKISMTITKIVPFIGAGVSTEYGLLSWSQLINKLKRRVYYKNKIKRDHGKTFEMIGGSYIAVSQFVKGMEDEVYPEFWTKPESGVLFL